jgi:hypothetical protein
VKRRLIAPFTVGLLCGVAFAVWAIGPRSGECDVFAGETAPGSVALSLEQGEQIERCGVLLGLNRRAVRATLGTAGLEPAQGPSEPEYYQLSGNRPGSVSFSGCVLALEYARGRVIRSEAACKED